MTGKVKDIERLIESIINNRKSNNINQCKTLLYLLTFHPAFGETPDFEKEDVKTVSLPFVKLQLHSHKDVETGEIDELHVRTALAHCNALLFYHQLNDADRFAVEKVRDEECIQRLEQKIKGVDFASLSAFDFELPAPSRDADITFTITTCKRLGFFVQTMTSFLNMVCRDDLKLIRRWICVDDNSSEEDRARMRELFPFFEFVLKTPETRGHARSLDIIRDMVDTKYQLHLEDDWWFFDPSLSLRNMRKVLEENSKHGKNKNRQHKLGQIAINKNMACMSGDYKLVGSEPVNDRGLNFYYYVHTYIDSEREKDKYVEYFRTKVTDDVPNPSGSVYWPHFTLRPSLIRSEIWKDLGPFYEGEGKGHFEKRFAERYVEQGWKTAFLDKIYCLDLGYDKTKNAYVLNEMNQFNGE